MKKEFLQNFQIGGKSLPDEAINAIMEENQRTSQPPPLTRRITGQQAERHLHRMM